MDIKKTLFSVVIPLYNKEAYIADTLRSVLNQSLDDFEIVVVNDGSTDKSLDRVKEFSDNRIKVYSTCNRGVSRARNFGVRHTQGDYIALLDADDVWEANYLAEMKRFMELFPGCGLYMSAHRVIEKDRVYYPCANMPEGIIDNYFKSELFHNITRPSATIVKADLFNRVGGFPKGMVSGEDSFFCAKIASASEMAFYPKVLVSYNKKFSGISLRYANVDSCEESWFDLYREGNFYRNEFVAYKAIRAAIRYALGFYKDKSHALEKQTQYTSLFKGRWAYLFLLNRTPYHGLVLYKKMKPFYSYAKSFITRRRNTLLSMYQKGKVENVRDQTAAGETTYY